MRDPEEGHDRADAKDRRERKRPRRIEILHQEGEPEWRHGGDDQANGSNATDEFTVSRPAEQMERQRALDDASESRSEAEDDRERDRAGHRRRTEQQADNAEALWQARKGYFFKPAAGHAAKAVYRGDKRTRGLWQHIVAGDYVAQEFAPPGERRIDAAEALAPLKADVRLYIYDGTVLLAAARLYQGQTTNFRTPGGGFAPVFFLQPSDLADGRECRSGGSALLSRT